MAKEYEGSSFFVQLRSLAQRVDSGVKELQSSVNDRKKIDTDDNNLAARRLLTDLLKETRSLKQEGLSYVTKFEEQGRLFSETLTACQNFLTTQSRRLIATEDYLEQYGYVKPPEKEAVSKKDESNDKVTECEENEEKENMCTDTDSSPVCNDPSDNPRAALDRTPQLDDFGISSYTMNFIHKLDVDPNVKPQSILNTLTTISDVAGRTPSSFHPDGPTLTPSMWGHYVEKNNSELTKGYTNFHSGSVCKEGHGLDRKNLVNGQANLDSDSPAVPAFQMAGAKPINKLQKPSQIPKVNSEQSVDSPLVPVFLTPGFKQIKKTPKPSQLDKVKVESIVHSPVAPQFLTPGFKQISKTLKASEENTVKTEPIIQSPQVPVFFMPGAKQIERSVQDDMTSQKSQVQNGGNFKPRVRRKVNTELFKDEDDDNVPKPPRLTMSLQDLTELTQSFYIKSGSSEPQLPTGGVSCRATPLTPVKPELLSEQLEKLGMMPLSGVMPKYPGSAFKPVDSRIPRPPKLLGRYTFSSDQNENLPPV